MDDLKERIEKLRKLLNSTIEKDEPDHIMELSMELDELIVQFMKNNQEA